MIVCRCIFKVVFFKHRAYSSDCRADLLAVISSNNDIPFCGGEVAATVQFVSGLDSDQGQDLPAATFTRNDMMASWTEMTQGVTPPGT